MINRLKFCIVINANANRSKKLLNQIIDFLKKDHEVEIFESKSIDSAKEIFKSLSTKVFDRLVIAGGDGSFNFAINEILQHSSLVEKKIGYIPTGTANILQIEAQIRMNTQAIAKVLIGENTKKISLSKINDKFFFLMVGIGFDGKIVASIDTGIKKYLGKVIFVLKGFQHLLFLNSEKIPLHVDHYEEFSLLTYREENKAH